MKHQGKWTRDTNHRQILYFKLARNVHKNIHIRKSEKYNYKGTIEK